MRKLLITLLTLSLIPAVCCRRESTARRSSEQVAFEKKLSAEISDHAAQIDRLKASPEAAAALAEARNALAVARQRMEELKEAPPEKWQTAQVFAVISVERLRKAHADAQAAAEANMTQPNRD